MSLSDCPRCWDTPCTCGYERTKFNYLKIKTDKSDGEIYAGPMLDGSFTEKRNVTYETILAVVEHILRTETEVTLLDPNGEFSYKIEISKKRLRL